MRRLTNFNDAGPVEIGRERRANSIPSPGQILILPSGQPFSPATPIARSFFHVFIVNSSTEVQAGLVRGITLYCKYISVSCLQSTFLRENPGKTVYSREHISVRESTHRRSNA